MSICIHTYIYIYIYIYVTFLPEHPAPIETDAKLHHHSRWTRASPKASNRASIQTSDLS